MAHRATNTNKMMAQSLLLLCAAFHLSRVVCASPGHSREHGLRVLSRLTEYTHCSVFGGNLEKACASLDCDSTGFIGPSELVKAGVVEDHPDAVMLMEYIRGSNASTPNPPNRISTKECEAAVTLIKGGLDDFAALFPVRTESKQCPTCPVPTIQSCTPELCAEMRATQRRLDDREPEDLLVGEEAIDVSSPNETEAAAWGVAKMVLAWMGVPPGAAAVMLIGVGWLQREWNKTQEKLVVMTRERDEKGVELQKLELRMATMKGKRKIIEARYEGQLAVKDAELEAKGGASKERKGPRSAGTTTALAEQNAENLPPTKLDFEPRFSNSVSPVV